MSYFETSAKENINVDNAFKSLITGMPYYIMRCFDLSDRNCPSNEEEATLSTDSNDDSWEKRNAEIGGS
jgi:hypothetical protein